jgi:AcrR family transcriptional regulator
VSRNPCKPIVRAAADRPAALSVPSPVVIDNLTSVRLISLITARQEGYVINVQKAGSTRQRTLAVAAELFLEFGYEGTPLSAIADRLGIAVPSLYWHFSSKEDLLFNFLDGEQRAFNKKIEAAAGSSTTPDGRLRAVAVAHVLAGLRHIQRARAFTQQFAPAQLARNLSPEHRAALEGTSVQYREFVAEIIASGVREGIFDVPDPHAVADALINMCEAVFNSREPEKWPSPDALAEIYGELALRLVGHRPPS